MWRDCHKQFLNSSLEIDDVSWIKQYNDNREVKDDVCNMFGRNGGKEWQIRQYLSVMN